MANPLMDLVSQPAGRASSRVASSPASFVVHPAPAADGSPRCFEEALEGIDVLGPASGAVPPIVPASPLLQEAVVPGPGGNAGQAMAGREEAQGAVSGASPLAILSGDAAPAFALLDAVPGDGAEGPAARTSVPGAAHPLVRVVDIAASDADFGASRASLPYGAWSYPMTGASGTLAAGATAPAESRTAVLAATPRAPGVPNASVRHAGLITPLVAAGAAGMRGGETSAVVRTMSAGGIVNFLEPASLDRGLAAMTSQVYGVAATPGAFSATLSANAGTPAGAAAPAGEQALTMLLGERLHYQIGRRMQHAVLRLDPPSMGSIEIQIRNEGGSLHVHLRASNAEVARQLQGIGDSLRQDLAQRQQGEVSIQIDDGTRDPDGRQRQRHARTWQQAPGRGLEMSEEPHAAAFSMNTEAR